MATRSGFWLLVKISLDALFTRRTADPPSDPDPATGYTVHTPRSPRNSIYHNPLRDDHPPFPDKREDSIHNGN